MSVLLALGQVGPGFPHLGALLDELGGSNDLGQTEKVAEGLDNLLLGEEEWHVVC